MQKACKVSLTFIPNENLTRVSTAIVEASCVGQGTDLVLKITDPRGKTLETLDDSETLRHHFTAWNSGNYQFCVSSLAKKKSIEFAFTIQTGVQAIDYSNIVTKKHLRPVELQAQKV